MSAIYQQISKHAKELEADIAWFLSELVRVPSFSGKEKEVCQVIKKELEAVDLGEVQLNGLGSVVGWIGSGPKVVAFDAHIVVSVGDGVILSGVPRGFQDLQRTSLVERLPRLIEVPAESSDSIHRYVQTGVYSDAANPVTRADSISVTCPSNAHGARQAILENVWLTFTVVDALLGPGGGAGHRPRPEGHGGAPITDQHPVHHRPRA